MTSVINKEFWCPRVRLYFDLFVKNPSSLQHLLLFGPPGSGKTTSAEWLVSQIWKQQKALMCISMNAADERSLEAIRQKIFPFLRASWSSIQVSSQVAPRFIILDECETLTEAAQLSLQTILDRDPKDVCMILICNSQSRIHPKLRQRLLRIRYDPSTQPMVGWKNGSPDAARLASDPSMQPLAASRHGSGEALLPLSDPSTQKNGSTHSACIQRTAFQEISRGDLRLALKKPETDARLEFYLNHHPDQIPEFLRTNSAELSTILTELLLLANTLFLLDKDLLEQINRCMPLLNAGVEWTRCYGLVASLIHSIQQKFEASLKTEGH
uniref:AAA+ ATPase domain-containing protein n=1 Tax=viral metagenome TaxID=1070528 RepID=A0A6C0K0G7_9ZZZZ